MLFGDISLSISLLHFFHLRLSSVYISCCFFSFLALEFVFQCPIRLCCWYKMRLHPVLLKCNVMMIANDVTPNIKSVERAFPTVVQYFSAFYILLFIVHRQNSAQKLYINIRMGSDRTERGGRQCLSIVYSIHFVFDIVLWYRKCNVM